MNVANKLQFPPGTIVARDRGYLDYALFERWTQEGVFFVTRVKKNTDSDGVPRQPERPLRGNIRMDRLITLNALNCEFKTLKQNLQVKPFVGTSANAVRIQIWTAANDERGFKGDRFLKIGVNRRNP